MFTPCHVHEVFMKALSLHSGFRLCDWVLGCEFLLPQPIRLSVQPVKVRRWELTMNPSSHNRRSDGVTRHCASSVVKVPGQSRASQRDGPQHYANAAASLNRLWIFRFPQQGDCRATQKMAKATLVPKTSLHARTKITGVMATARAQGLTE